MPIRLDEIEIEPELSLNTSTGKSAGLSEEERIMLGLTPRNKTVKDDKGISTTAGRKYYREKGIEKPAIKSATIEEEIKALMNITPEERKIIGIKEKEELPKTEKPIPAMKPLNAIRLDEIDKIPDEASTITDTTKTYRLSDVMTGDEPSWDKMSKFQKVLDVLGRPGYAFKAAMKQSNEDYAEAMKNIPKTGNPFKDWIAEQKAMLPAKDTAKRRLESAWQGLSGQERNDMNKLWESVGVENVPFLGFASEIAVDPLMWGGGAGYKAITKTIGKGLELTGKGIKVMPGVTKGLEIAAEKIQPVTSALKEMFITKTGIGKLGDLIEQHLGKREYLKGKEVKFGIKTRNVIQNISKKTGQSVDDVEKQIVNLIEQPEIVPPGAIPEARALANTLKTHLDNILITEMNSGISIKGLGTGKAADIARVRYKLNLLRDTKREQLLSAKQSLIQQLDELSKKKIGEVEKGLVSERTSAMQQLEKLRGKKITATEKGLTAETKGLKQEAFETNKAKIDSLVKETGFIDDQLKILEKQLNQAKQTGKPTKRIEMQIQKLENEYWYRTGDIAERLHDIPELAKGTAYANRIKEIEDILTKSRIEIDLGKKGIGLTERIKKSEGILSKGEIEVDLGRAGTSLGKKIYGIEKELETGLPPTGKRAGKLLKDLTDIRAKRDMGYFPRITTKEAMQYLKSASQSGYGSRAWNTKIANSLRRKTDDFTLEEFNDFVAENGLKSLGGKSVEEFFMQNPAYAVATRGIRSAKAVTSAEFLNDVGKQFGLTKAPEFWQELPDTITKLNPSLKGLKFDPEIMSEVTRVTKSYIDPQELGVFRKGFDTVQNLWKRWTLAPFPKYHLRNMVGNSWNNYLAGVNPLNYPKAQAIQMYRKFKGKGGNLEKVALGEMQKLGITPQQADDVILNAEKTGVLGRGWYGGDIETAIEREISGKKGITGYGMAVGTVIENNARLAHFVDRLGKGDDALSAAKSVKKYLFDYQDLTAFERQVMKRLMPFYTWTRKNIPLQLENIVKQPQKYAPLAVPLRQRDPQDLLRLKYSQPQLYEKLPVELKREVDTVTYVPLEGLIPAADLTKMVRPQEFLVELLTPYLRTPIELSLNKSFYFENEIQRYPKETQELLKMDIPVKLKYIAVSMLPQARLLNEINKIVKKNVRKEELTPAEQAFAQGLSSVYKMNIKDLRLRAMQEVNKKMGELERGAFWAKRNKRDKEYERIKKTYDELKEQMKEIK